MGVAWHLALSFYLIFNSIHIFAIFLRPIYSTFTSSLPSLLSFKGDLFAFLMITHISFTFTPCSVLGHTFFFLSLSIRDTEDVRYTSDILQNLKFELLNCQKNVYDWQPLFFRFIHFVRLHFYT